MNVCFVCCYAFYNTFTAMPSPLPGNVSMFLKCMQNVVLLYFTDYKILIIFLCIKPTVFLQEITLIILLNITLRGSLCPRTPPTTGLITDNTNPQGLSYKIQTSNAKNISKKYEQILNLAFGFAYCICFHREIWF